MSNTVGNKTFKGGAAYDAVGKHKVDLVKRASALKFLANAIMAIGAHSRSSEYRGLGDQ